MLEKRIVPEEAAFGQGYLFCAAAGLQNGSLVKLNGTWSAVQVTGVFGQTQANKPGFASAGAPMFTTLLHTDSATAVPQTWIIKKYEFQRETADLALDAILSGEGIVAYNQGFFDTDVYDGTITSALAVGSYLYASGGALASGNTTVNPNAPKRAIFWGIKSSYDTNYWAKAPIYIQILPTAVGISGWV